MVKSLRNGRTAKACAAITACAATALIATSGASAAEPNNDFTTATGPLTAGQVFKANLQAVDDADFQFFYLTDTAQVTITTINATEKRGGAADRGRTIVSSLLRARKGKLPEPIVGSGVTVKPGSRDSVSFSLLPGKYFIPVGRALSDSPPLPNVPFKLQIGPVGSTTDSHEIFEARCRTAKRELGRVQTSVKHAKRHLAKAKHNDAKAKKIVKLKLRLRAKRDKASSVKKAEKFVCSIPR